MATRKDLESAKGPAAALKSGENSVVPYEPSAGHLVPIEIDATKIASQANVLETLGEIKAIVDGVAGDLEISDQNIVTREPNREVFQATRTVRVNKPARAALPEITPLALAGVLGIAVIIGVAVVLIVLYG